MIKKTEFKGFRRPTEFEREMIEGFLIGYFKAEKNTLAVIQGLWIGLGILLAMMLGWRVIQDPDNAVLIISGTCLVLGWPRVYQWILESMQVKRDRVRNLASGIYEVLPVWVACYENGDAVSPSTFAQFRDAFGHVSEDCAMVHSASRKLIDAHDRRALLMRMPDNLFYMLFARVTDLNTEGE